MTLKRTDEFGSDYNWKPRSTFAGCKAIIKVAVDNLKLIEPFNDDLSKEWSSLVAFELNVRKELEAIMFDAQRPYTAQDVNAMYETQVNALVKTLQTQELKNKAYSVLMAVCGFIVGLLAVAPLGIPLCFSSVRNYVGSFFEAPKVSAQQFQTQIQTAVTQLGQLLSNEIKCFYDFEKDEYAFSNVRA